MSAPESFPPVEFRLRGGDRLSLSEDGFVHPAAVRFLGDVFTRYQDVTHVSVSTRTVRVGTRRSVYLLNRSQFQSGLDAEGFVGQLVRRIAALPDGPTRIAAMRDIDRRAALVRPQRVTWAFLLLCLGVQILQLFGDGRVEAAGAFSASLVRSGEVWRLVTANLLHATPWLPVHFVLNGIGLLALGSLLEWSVGSARAALVMAAAGVGAMAAGLLVDYEEALGASGVVMGVFGALVFLELRHGAELPAHWRLPRAVIWLGMLLQFALEALAWAFLPIIATGAHIGGFVAGFVTCALVGRAGLARRPAGVLVLATNGLAAVVLAASVASAVTAWRHGPDWVRRAESVLARDEVSPHLLNNLAWVIATRQEADREELDIALRLAVRAVDDTDRSLPTILDTLAEVHFQRGESADALLLIEEAMRLDPGEPYYLGQRDRFLGHRDAEDRPDPPPITSDLFERAPPREGPLVPGAPEVGA